MSALAVAGGGAFGTALAMALSCGRGVTLWMRDPAQAAETGAARENRRRLPGVRLRETIAVTSRFADVTAPTLLLAIPAQALGGFLADHAGALGGRTIVLASKGIDLKSGHRGSSLVQEAVPDARVAVLSGPSFAIDIAQGRPTALTLAGGDPALAEALSGATLRIYRSDDILGVELGGALKNVIALAAGMAIGAGMGDSARAALVARGFAEMTRFATARGASAETLAGLSGLGDLVLTCTSEKSRNFRAGQAIGAGAALPEGQTIEGLATAQAVRALADRHGVEMPLTSMVADVTEGRRTVADAASVLMTRPLKEE